MVQPQTKNAPTIIRDSEGQPLDQSLPLSSLAYATIERCCWSSSAILATGESERAAIKARAYELIRAHDTAREKNPRNSCGTDLNNFWVLFEDAPHYIKETATPRQKWQLEVKDGYSEKYLAEPLQSFAAQILEAYRIHGINPEDLKDRVQAATSASDYEAIAWRELRTIYIHLRDLGYSDRDLIG